MSKGQEAIKMDDDDDFVEAHGNEDGEDYDEVLDDPVSSRLRRQPGVHYSAAALPSDISTEDEPNLRKAMKSPEWKHCLVAIRE